MNAVVSTIQAPEPANLLEIISRAANDPNTDVAKVEKMLEMFERITARNAEVAFNTAMRACQEELPNVLRNKKNDSTNSLYADLEQIDKTARPVYTKHGFSLSFGTAYCPFPGQARMTCLVSHIGGHSRGYQADIPLDLTGPKGNQNKTGTQGFGSTMSYGQRYLTKLIFNLTLTNEDNDGQDEKPRITEQQVADLEALMQEVGADKRRFLRYYNLNSLDQILACNFKAVVELVEAKRKQ